MRKIKVKWKQIENPVQRNRDGRNDREEEKRRETSTEDKAVRENTVAETKSDMETRKK